MFSIASMDWARSTAPAQSVLVFKLFALLCTGRFSVKAAIGRSTNRNLNFKSRFCQLIDFLKVFVKAVNS